MHSNRKSHSGAAIHGVTSNHSIGELLSTRASSGSSAGLGDEAATRLVQNSTRLARRVEALETENGRSVESLHRLHRDLRVALVDLRLVEAALGPAVFADYRQLEDSLRGLRKSVGVIRDVDVAIQLLTKQSSSRTQGATDQARASATALSRTAARSRFALAQNGASTELAAHLRRYADELSQRRHDLARHLTKPAVRAVKKARRRIANSLRRARAKPSGDRMHRLRVEMRRGRDLLRTVAPNGGGKAYPTGQGRKLLHHLGRLHDYEVATRWLDQVGPDRRKVRRVLKSRRRELKRILLHNISRQRLLRHLRPPVPLQSSEPGASGNRPTTVSRLN